jgi:hypothetical protein
MQIVGVANACRNAVAREAIAMGDKSIASGLQANLKDCYHLGEF